MSRALSPADGQPTGRATSDERRPQILRAAARLFQAKGYHATSMDEIAAALGINKATIYHHFPGGKSDLLYGINVEALRDLADRVGDLSTVAPAIERLNLHLACMLEMAAESPDVVAVYHEESRWLRTLLPPERLSDIRRRERWYLGLLEDVVADGIASGELRSCHVGFTAAMLIEGVVASHRASRAVPGFDAATQVAMLSALVSEGILLRDGAGTA